MVRDEGAHLIQESHANPVTGHPKFVQRRVERMRLGRSSPDGYYEDSHQLLAIVADLLVPFRTGA